MASRLAQNIFHSTNHAAGNVPNDNIGNAILTNVLPILVMLDVSPSMNDNERIEEQNTALFTLLESLSRNYRIRKITRISFCLFTREIKYTTNFMPLTDLKFPASPYLAGVTPKICTYQLDGHEQTYVLNVPRFQALDNDGTDIPRAVDTALTMMQTYVSSLPKNKQQHYVPFLFFTSDGNPDLTQYHAIDRDDYNRRTAAAADRMNNICSVKSHIDDLIIPFFVGIGNAEEAYLRSFCNAFKNSVQLARQEGEKPVNGKFLTFSNIAEQIAKAIAQSITLRESSQLLLSKIDTIIKQLQDSNE